VRGGEREAGDVMSLGVRSCFLPPARQKARPGRIPFDSIPPWGKGVRIGFTYNQLDESLIWLLTIYAKSRQDNAPAHILRALKEELVNAS
jgi:hypothetical protein